MRYRILPAGLDTRPQLDSRGWSTRFGDLLFRVGDETLEDDAAAAAGLAAAPGRSHPTQVERLHLVVQKGRLFQQEHPEVPVLLDKGRYLVVDVDPGRAKESACGDRPCFAILPLREAAVAFDTPAPRATRSAELPWVRALTDRVTRMPFESDLTRLVAFGTRFSTGTQYPLAANFAKTQLEQLGFATQLQPIAVDGRTSLNVIAEKAGGGAAPRAVVIAGAHLDSINLAGGPAAPAPGADDDGSGSAGILAIARALGEHAAVHDLRLILFGGEEQGLRGSRQYVASLSPAERARIRAVVNMDMIATLNTPQPTVLLEGAALSQSLIDGLADAAATYSQLKVQTSLHPFNSDHVSFLDANIPAVLTIEGTDDANDNIHSDRDTLAHVDFDLALDVLRMNVAFLAQAVGKMP